MAAETNTMVRDMAYLQRSKRTGDPNNSRSMSWATRAFLRR